MVVRKLLDNKLEASPCETYAEIILLVTAHYDE